MLFADPGGAGRSMRVCAGWCGLDPTASTRARRVWRMGRGAVRGAGSARARLSTWGMRSASEILALSRPSTKATMNADTEQPRAVIVVSSSSELAVAWRSFFGLRVFGRRPTSRAGALGALELEDHGRARRAPVALELPSCRRGRCSARRTGRWTAARGPCSGRTARGRGCRDFDDDVGAGIRSRTGSWLLEQAGCATRSWSRLLEPQDALWCREVAP